MSVHGICCFSYSRICNVQLDQFLEYIYDSETGQCPVCSVGIRSTPWGRRFARIIYRVYIYRDIHSAEWKRQMRISKSSPKSGGTEVGYQGVKLWRNWSRNLFFYSNVSQCKLRFITSDKKNVGKRRFWLRLFQASWAWEKMLAVGANVNV